MEISGIDSIKFSTGKELYAHNCIIGISEESNDVNGGYDGIAGFFSDFTPQEREELVKYMCDLWQRWGLGLIKNE